MDLHVKQFVALADDTFAEALATFGFAPVASDNHDSWHCSRTYRSGERYIEITASCHPRDGGPECRVILGDGSHEWPDRDWNAIALWRLIGKGGNYCFKRVEDLDALLPKMSSDLLSEATDFLQGDVARFTAKRKEQNRGRTPYTIHEPQPDGSYSSRPDPESEDLKSRFS